MSDTNGSGPEIDILRRQLQTLWAKIDRVHSIIWEKEKAGLPLTNTEVHIRDLTGEAMKIVPYPGEPPEAVEEEETRPPDDTPDE